MDDMWTATVNRRRAAPRRHLRFGIAAFAMASLVGLPGPVSAQENDGGFGAADAGSLGVTEPVDIWCVIDAGSFGIPNPIKVCSGQS